LQIEYNKLYAYPDLTLATVQHAFFEWLDTARPRLKIPMELRALTGRQIELAFVGINSAIGATLTTRELSVFVEWEGRIWDFFRCFDVWPRLAIGGYICEHCRPEQRTIFPCMHSLWQDHLFEPLLEWVNGKLAAADAVSLYGSPSTGWTHAELVSKHGAQEASLHIRIPARVSPHQIQ
jgi:hypothetical protein